LQIFSMTSLFWQRGNLLGQSFPDKTGQYPGLFIKKK
jgi:hypothetical protein